MPRISKSFKRQFVFSKESSERVPADSPHVRSLLCCQLQINRLNVNRDAVFHGIRNLEQNFVCRNWQRHLFTVRPEQEGAPKRPYRS